jgi:ribosomal protein L11 methyltransferase
MNYIKVNLHTDEEEFVKDFLIYYLAEIGFESFEQTSLGIVAYCPENIFDENILRQIIENKIFTNKINYRTEHIKDKNWNEIWEQNSFVPIVIDQKVCVHSSAKVIRQRFDYDIIINPKQSFGTGGHETSKLIIKQILKLDLQNKTVLDMGCGTGILSILASKLGANNVTAVDIDKWAFDNAKENFILNNVDIQVFMGDIEIVENQKFDIILANINRNILLKLLPFFAKMLITNGLLIISGFYEQDFEILNQRAVKCGTLLTKKEAENSWQMLVYKKII